MMESPAQSGLEEAGLDGEVTFKEVNRKPTWHSSPQDPSDRQGLCCTGGHFTVPVGGASRGLKVPHSFSSPAERRKTHSGFLNIQALKSTPYLFKNRF